MCRGFGWVMTLWRGGRAYTDALLPLLRPYARADRTRKKNPLQLLPTVPTSVHRRARFHIFDIFIFHASFPRTRIFFHRRSLLYFYLRRKNLVWFFLEIIFPTKIHSNIDFVIRDCIIRNFVFRWEEENYDRERWGGIKSWSNNRSIDCSRPEIKGRIPWEEFQSGNDSDIERLPIETVASCNIRTHLRP